MGLEGTPSLSDRKLTSVTGSSGNDRDAACFPRDSDSSMPQNSPHVLGKASSFGESVNPTRASQRAVPMHVDVIKSEADMVRITFVGFNSHRIISTSRTRTTRN
jgi:hypothetical protein